MSKTKKYPPLEVGQRIWIESTASFYRGERYLTEYEIVEANNNSAYAVRVDDLQKENPSRKRIVQKTREVIARYSLGDSYRFWASKEAFEGSVQRQTEIHEMRQKALKKVNEMNYDELKQFLS